MVALPYSLFKIVQGLCYPRRSTVCSYGPWEISDFSTTHNIIHEISLDAEVVIISLQHEDLDYILNRYTHIDYKFHLIISAYDKEELGFKLSEYDNTVISSVEGHYGVMLHKFAKDSYIEGRIKEGVDIEIDDDLFFLPDFEPSKWSQDQDLILFDSPEGLIKFRVPHDFSLVRTSQDLLWIIESVLLSPWHKKYSNKWVPTRRPGNTPGLSFSGGVDSTAALCLMPENTVLFYLERDFESMIKHENALHFISKLKNAGRTVVNVKSNHEQIRKNYGKNPGFSTDYACMAHLILLADYLDLDSAATGMPLENTYFFHGTKVRDFAMSRFWKFYSPMFNFSGLPLYQPVAGCSEVLNNKIVRESQFSTLASSCLRSHIVGKECGACWKCFRKNIFNNKPWNMSPEISKFLAKRPLKQGLATLYALQILHNSGEEIPPEAEDLQSIVNSDLDFLNHYWPPYIDLIPTTYREFARVQIENYASPMTQDLLGFDKQVLITLRGDAI